MGLRALIFDSYYDKHRGVIAYIRVFEGEIKGDQTIYFLATGVKAISQEVGYFKPKLEKNVSIKSGEVGYIVTGLKDLGNVKVGDTISDSKDISLSLAGYKEVKPMVFASIFPTNADDYPKLRDSISKLKANDAALTFETENIPALGFGFRCGFLGLLHMDIVQERLSREFDLDLVITTPSVEYKVITTSNETLAVFTPSQMPDPTQISTILEPYCKVEILTPEKYTGRIIELINSHRGTYEGVSLISEGQLQITSRIPLAEMIIDFYDDLKSITKGFATMSYETEDFVEGDLIKIDILVNRNSVDPLSFLTHRSRAEEKSRVVCEKLKELIPRQQFEIIIQAATGSRILARETIKPFRKDVTEKLYGGDMSRRIKLLNKQKAGKKRMKMVGNVEIPQSAFLNVLKKS
jgi:GTP-binding protein LepA